MFLEEGITWFSEYYRALKRDQLNFLVAQPKSPHPPSPLVINNDQSLIQKSMMLTINFFTINN